MLKKKNDAEWPVLVYSDPHTLDMNEVDPSSLFKLALRVIYEDMSLAFRFIQFAAEKGHEESLYNLAQFYLTFSNQSIPVEDIGPLPNVEKALQALEKAVSLWDSERSYITLGDVCDKLQIHENAIKWFKLCSELKGSVIASLKLGVLYVQLNDLGNALDCFEKVSDRSALASINVAALCYPDNIEKVIKYYENALRLDPSIDSSEGVQSRLPSLQSLKETLEQQKNRSKKVTEKRQQPVSQPQPNIVNQPPNLSSSRDNIRKKKSKRVKNTQTQTKEPGLMNTIAKVSLALGGALLIGYVLHKIVPRETTTTTK